MSRIASRFYVMLRDTNYAPVARFDSWNSLSYSKNVDAVGSYSITMNANDSRVDLFDLDGLVEIYRSIPGMSIPWYLEFQALHRLDDIDVQENGKQIYLSSGPTPVDFLARTCINYAAATIRSYKLSPAETAVKEYVEENCGISATVANGRETDGVLPDFVVEADSGAGDSWEGDRAYENLLDVVKDICKQSDMDFDVIWDKDSEQFIFRTYVDQLGLDRTTTGIDANTGLNAAGNVPVVFSLQYGNVRSMKWTWDRMSESNTISVLGEGDGATRIVVPRQYITIADSRWNRREISRPKTGFISEMEQYGDEALDEAAAREVIGFFPLLQERCMYGIHYAIGDRITVLWKGVPRNKRITGIQNTVGISESISISFSDVMKT